jgi:hypothetical protein
LPSREWVEIQVEGFEVNLHGAGDGYCLKVCNVVERDGDFCATDRNPDGRKPLCGFP